MRSITAVFAATTLAFGLAAPAQAASECGGVYQIRSGDSLGKVARRCGHTVAAILAANPEITDPGRIGVGQTIALPGGAAQAVSKTSNEGITEQTVLKGRIFAGRRCALIETRDGEVFGLASKRHSFRSDTIVEVKGRKVADTECGQTYTIAVSDLSNAGLNF